jgi:hypothetical protein
MTTDRVVGLRRGAAVASPTAVGFSAMATVNRDGAPSPRRRVEVLGNIGPNWLITAAGLLGATAHLLKTPPSATPVKASKERVS